MRKDMYEVKLTVRVAASSFENAKATVIGVIGDPEVVEDWDIHFQYIDNVKKITRR